MRWTIARWWEPDIVPDDEMLEALRSAIARFVQYLQASDVRVDESVDTIARTAMSDGIKVDV